MLTGSLATTGLIVLGIYIIGMLGIGVYCNKKYANNLSGFLTGGRNLGPTAPPISAPPRSSATPARLTRPAWPI